MSNQKEDNNNKTMIGITSIQTQSDLQKNEITVRYLIMTKEQLEEEKQHLFINGSNKVEPKVNRIMLETPDPKLLYALFKLIGRLGYSVIEYNEKGLRLGDD